MESDLFPLSLDQALDFGGFGGPSMDDLINETNFDLLPFVGLEETQPPVVVPQTVDMEGIQATDVNSLFEQFEEVAASHSMDGLESHCGAVDTPLKSQSLPASRVCSTTNSPATTPPTTPPPDVLRKLRSRQSQAQKRKSTIMLPLGAPAKRGRGQATSLEMTRPSCSSSKLQKILSRSHSASASRSESPVGFQPVQPAVVNPSGLQPAQLQAISVKLAAASDHPPASVVACSVVSSSRLGQVTDPAVARSIMSKTPRALSLLTSPVGLEDAVARSEPRVTRNRSSTQLGSLPPPLVIGKPGNLKDATNPMVGPKRVAKQPSSALSQAASTKWCATTSAVRDRSVQPTSNGQAQGRTRREDEHPMRNNIVVSRGAENIQAECLDSVLDHDYCRDSLRRVIVDDFDLAISPTKLHGPKPMQKVKSLPVIKADPASALQASSLHQGQAHQGKTAAVKDSDVVSAAATASQAQATASASDAATQNLNKPSSQPLPTVDLVSVLKNVQSIQNLFTLENGTLKLHPSVMASMDPASQVMSLVSQNAPPATSVPSSDTAASATVSDTGQNVGRVLQQTPAAPAACLTVHNPMQTPQGQAVAHSSGATTQSTQQLVPAQSLSTVSKSSELARETLQKQNDLSQLSSMLQLSHTASARTASKKQSKQPLRSTETAGERIARCSPVPEHQPEISPSWAPGQSSPNACFSHSRQAMNDLEKTTSSSGSACTRIWQSAQNRVTGADKQCEDIDLEKPAPSPEEASNPVINGTADTNVDSDILHCPNSTVDDVGSQALYSMPLFDVEEPPSIDLSDRVVAPIETHSHQKTSNAERCRSPLPLHCPEPSETCDAVEPLQPSPSTLPVIGPEERPRSCSPHDFQASPEAGTSQFHQEDSQHFTDDFSRVWEEHSLNAENEMLFRTSESHHKTVTHTPSTLPSDPDDQTHSVERTSTSKRTRPSRRYRQSRSWKPGSSPIKEDNSGLFNKIPTYYTALSIPTKTGRKQLTAEDAGGISISDFLPADGSPDHNNEKDMMYNKMPPYFSCFTNSTKYDETAPPANFNPASESREPEKVAFSSEQVSYARSRSQRQSASKSPSPARSPRNLRSRGRKGLRKRRRSSSSSASSRSGSRTRSWRTSRRKCRRSPSLSGSSCSSSQSRSNSHSSSRSWSRSRSRYSHSSSRSRSRSRSNSRSRSRGRRYCSRERERYSGSHEHRRERISKGRQMRKAERREIKIKKMEERKIVYVGRIPEGYTRRQLYKRFEQYGKIEEVSVHFREAGDNYGFVTYYSPQDAFRAIDKGNSAPNERQFDLCFGGRRHFCANEYADLDGNLVIEEEYAPMSTKNPMDFDELLKQAQRKLKQKS